MSTWGGGIGGSSAGGAATAVLLGNADGLGIKLETVMRRSGVRR